MSIIESKTIRKLITIVIIILLFLLLKDWIKPFIITSLGGYTKKETVIKRDTLPPIIDTIDLPKEKRIIDLDSFKKEVIKDYKITYEKQITNSNGDIETIIEERVKDSIYKYTTAINDSLIKGTIQTLINSKNCNIFSQSLEYTPKFPKFITKTVPIEIFKTETLSIEPRPKIGIGLSANNIGMFGIDGAYITKNDWVFRGSYKFPVSQSTVLFNNRQIGRIVEIGILKTF